MLPDESAAPEDDALLADAVGLALLVLLDPVTAERLAFVLHDLFAVPFDEIGRILGNSTDATKMLASRARRKVRAVTHPSTDNAQKRRAVVDVFLAAALGGDFEGLLAVLDPDVVLRAYTAGGVVVTLGATEVAGRAQRFAAIVTARRRCSWMATGHPVVDRRGHSDVADDVPRARRSDRRDHLAGRSVATGQHGPAEPRLDLHRRGATQVSANRPGRDH